MSPRRPLASRLLRCVACLALPALACASDAPVQIPTSQELAGLAAAPPPGPTPLAAGASVDRFELVGPLPDRLGGPPVALDLPGEAPLADRIARGAAVSAPESLRCLARQVAGFALARGEFPEPQLFTFMTARCGVPGAPAVFLLQQQVPDAASDEEIASAWSPAMDEALDARLRAVHGGDAHETLAGVALVRGGGRAAYAVATMPERVALSPTDLRVAPDGRFVLSGELRVALEDLSATVGVGALGARACEPDPAVAPPAFRFHCLADPGDGWNYLTLYGRPRGRILSDALLLAIVRAPDEEARTFRKAHHTAPRELGPRDDLAEVFTDHVNRVRALRGAAPLRLADAQSRTARGLAPHFFRARLGEAGPAGEPPDAVLDLVALGLLAGWEVDGLVSDGDFQSAQTPTSDVSDLLSDALQLPGARSALLDPEASAIAVGGLRDEHTGALAALVGAYQLLDPGELHVVAAELRARLVHERALLGLEPPRELAAVDALAMQAAERVRDGTPPREALEQLLQQSSEHLRLAVEGFYGEASAPEEVRLPEALLREPGLALAIGVSVHRPAEEPWGRYVVFFVAARLGGWYR